MGDAQGSSMVEAAGLWPAAAHDGREHGGRAAGAALLPGQARSSPAWDVGREGRAASGGAGSKAEGQENGSDAGEEAAGWVDYSAQNEEAVDGAEPQETQDAHQWPAARPGDARDAPGVSCVHPSSPPGHHAEALLLSDGERPGAGPHGAHSPAEGKGPQADKSAPNKRGGASAAQEWGAENGPILAINVEGIGMETGQAADEANRVGSLPAEEEPKESGRAESDVTGVGEGEGEGEVLAGAADDEAGSAEQLAEPVEGLRRLAASAALKAAPREGGGQTSALSSTDILQCGGVARWEALLANIAAGEIQLNPETGSYEHRKVVKKEEQAMPAATYGNGRAQEKPRERRQAPERAPTGRRRRSDPEAGAPVTSKEGSTGAPKLAALVDNFVQKMEALFEQDLTAEMQRRASRCTPSTLGAKVSRLAGHPNAGRGPASGYMDESAKNSAALREAAEPIIKALLFRGHYGSTTLAASMAGPLFYPANAAGPELLAALREACQGAASAAGRAGPMARLLQDLQDGARPVLCGEGSPEEQDARLQAWGAAVRGCCGAAVERLEAVDFFKLCCAEAAAAAQEEAAGVMLTAKRSKRAILSSRQAAGSKSKWEHLEDSVAPLAQIVAQRYVAAALHGGEGFSGLHARLQALRGDLLRAGANLEQWRNPPPPSPPPPDHAAADPARLIQAIAGVAGAAGAAPSLAVADGAVGAVVREYAWADPGKWGLLWQQQGAACNGPQVPEPVVLPLGGSAPQEPARRRRRGGGDGEEEDEYVGRWGRRVWRMKGAKKEWFNGRVVKGPKRRDEVKPADKCYVMRYKPQDDPQGRSTLEKLTEAQVIRACENYERAVQQGECAREDTDSDDDLEQPPPQPSQHGATAQGAADSGRGKKRAAEEAGLGGGDERGGGSSKRKKGPSISEAAARRLLQHLAAFFGPSPGAFAAARALYCGAERLFPRWEARVDGEGRHVYQWAVGKKVWHCYTRMQVRETQEEEGATPLPPRIQLSTTPRPPQPTPKPALPTPRLPGPRPPPPIAKPASRNSSPRPPSPSPPPAPRPPSAAVSKRPRPSTASPSGEAPVVFSFEGPPPGCRLTPAQEAEVMEVVRAQGWEIRQEVRKHGISAGQVDKYYMPPNGDKRLTSLRKVWEYLHFGKGASGRTARDRSGTGASTSDQADFDAARGGVAALLAAQAEVAAEDVADGAAEAGDDDEWAALGVGQGFGVAAAERVKRRRRKPGATPGAAGSPPTTPTGAAEAGR